VTCITRAWTQWRSHKNTRARRACYFRIQTSVVYIGCCVEISFAVNGNSVLKCTSTIRLSV
jgi:hypothetical protein